MIFDKDKNLIFSTYQKNVSVPMTDIIDVGIKKRRIYGGLHDEHSGAYRAYDIQLRDKNGQRYSVLSHAGFNDVETMAIQIAQFLKVDLVIHDS
ncbi:hypothetical protein [Lacimicrobium sp. SS2-24]|uniref:hypothetical protein n=1 Tax=Lacimicrobium sp. SS2-24 TaxID=2005569 RepID=UPI0011306EF3|nr:hypothetical protein [Lacimicrobium sp. SS2-24]